MVVSDKYKKSKRKLRKFKNYRKTKLKFQKGGKFEILLEKIKDQIYSVVVSFDAATEDTYREIRGAKLSLVIDGIKAIICRI